jgi:hypothetical protein
MSIGAVNESMIVLYEFPKDHPELESEDCSICFIAFQDSKEQVTKVACKHLFHNSCLGKWFQRIQILNKKAELKGERKHQFTCPMCRDVLSEEDATEIVGVFKKSLRQKATLCCCFR